MGTGAGQTSELLPLADRIRITEKRLDNLRAGAGSHTRREREHLIAHAEGVLNRLSAEAGQGSYAK